MLSIRGNIINKFLRTFFNLNPSLCKDQIAKMRIISKPSIFKTPLGYTYEIHNLDGINVEVLKKTGTNSKNLVYVLHGGAYISGMSDVYRRMGKRYSIAGHDATVVFLDYRLAPDFLYPCALEDAIKGWNFILEQGYKEENILIIGDSAGGHLTISLTLKLQELGKKLPKALICMSPWLDMTASGKSYKENYNKDILFGAQNLEYSEAVATEFLESPLYTYFSKTDRNAPNISLINADYHDFPPMLVTSGSDEMLLSDSEIVVNKLKNAGCDVTWDITEGMFHVFPMYDFLIPESYRAIHLIYDFIRKKLE